MEWQPSGRVALFSLHEVRVQTQPAPSPPFLSSRIGFALFKNKKLLSLFLIPKRQRRIKKHIGMLEIKDLLRPYCKAEVLLCHLSCNDKNVLRRQPVL